MFYVYILQSLKDFRSYVGSTNNFSRRFSQHNLGLVRSTKYRIPFRLILTEEFQTNREARKRENWWKSGAGRRKMKEIFKSSQ